ncbi:unnamed protein product [Protopolystoma xenopodis]|uniref:Uncharacterized protein n=1 Tax=Protopolystoma xenopodis TaxID=117903 RepID=A0A448XT60_9PLAT|nr:unnamed protein product [Protopolystoma xenopodis]
MCDVVCPINSSSCTSNDADGHCQQTTKLDISVANRAGPKSSRSKRPDLVKIGTPTAVQTWAQAAPHVAFCRGTCLSASHEAGTRRLQGLARLSLQLISINQYQHQHQHQHQHHLIISLRANFSLRHLTLTTPEL